MPILNRFRKIAETEFFDVITSSEFIYDAPHLIEPSRLRLKLHDGSFIDVRYIHLDSERNVVDDDVTSPTLSPEENFRKILRWITEQARS